MRLRVSHTGAATTKAYDSGPGVLQVGRVGIEPTTLGLKEAPSARQPEAGRGTSLKRPRSDGSVVRVVSPRHVAPLLPPGSGRGGFADAHRGEGPVSWSVAVQPGRHCSVTVVTESVDEYLARVQSVSNRDELDALFQRGREVAAQSPAVFIEEGAPSRVGT
jgi:hypothetical protein